MTHNELRDFITDKYTGLEIAEILDGLLCMDDWIDLIIDNDLTAPFIEAYEEDRPDDTL